MCKDNYYHNVYYTGLVGITTHLRGQVYGTVAPKFTQEQATYLGYQNTVHKVYIARVLSQLTHPSTIQAHTCTHAFINPSIPRACSGTQDQHPNNHNCVHS